MQKQPPPAIAVTLNLPTAFGWAIQAADRSWRGKDLKTLVACLAANRFDSATLSLTLLIPLDLGQGGPHEPQN